MASEVVAPGRGEKPPQEATKTKVFISYSRKNMGFADRLEAALEERGFEPLIDRTEIYAFEDWWKRIQALIARADTVIFVLSPDAVASEVCAKEVGYAASLNKRFAPIVLRRVDDKLVPEALARLNFIFFDDDALFADSLNRLCEALATDIDWIRKHTEFGEAARHWAAANRSSGLLLRSPVLEEAERWIASRPPNAPAPTAETQTFIAESRRGATRRRNILTSSLAAGLVLALALAGLAYWQRGVAIEQRKYAEQALDAGIRTSNSLTGGLAQRFRNRTGIQSALVKYILEQALILQEKLASFGRSSPDLKRSESKAYREISTTLLTIGDSSGALAAADHARQIIETVLAVQPEDPDTQLDVVGSYEGLGDVLLAQGKREDALAAYRKALATAQRVVGRDTGTAAVARNYLNIGDALDEELRPNEALTFYQMGLALWQKLVDRDQANAEWQRFLGASYERVGTALLAQGKREEALAAFQKRLAIAQGLCDNDPDNTEFQFALSVAHIKIGDVLLEQGKPDEALNAYQKGLVIRQKLADNDQSNSLWQREVAINYNMIADLMVTAGKLDEALAAYQKGLAIELKLTAGDPGNAQWQRDLFLTYERIATILEKEGKLDAALKAYRDSLAVAGRLAAIDRNNTLWQHDLAISYARVGDMLMAQGKLDEALKAYRDSLPILDRLVAADRSNSRWQRDLAVTYNRVGDVLMAQGQLDEALQAYRDSLAIAGHLAAADRSNTLWQRDLSLSYEKVGDVLMAQGKLEEALEAYRESLPIQERLAAADPGNTEWQRDLSVLCNKVGDVLVRQGKLEEALTVYENGLAIRVALVAKDRSNAQWQRDLQSSIGRIGDLAYKLILARNFARALEASDQVIPIAPGMVWLRASRAHALMFIGRIDEARSLYLQYRGEKNVQNGKSWETIVLEDFAELHRVGLTNPLMDEIENRFAAPE